MLAPERNRRVDLVIAASIAVVILVVASIIWLRSDARGTTSVEAVAPAPAVATASNIPSTVSERWRSDSGATTSPVTVGGVVVTGDDGVVTGRDPASGDQLWFYRRDLALCGVVSSWQTAVSVYEDGRGCSQVTELDGSTGARKSQRNSDADSKITVRADGTYVTSQGSTRLELWRSDLVRTLEYGRVDAPVNPGSQPRTGCALLSATSNSTRLAVLEQCPGEGGPRLTLMNPAPKDSTKPDEYGSSVLADAVAGAAGTAVLGISGDRTAVSLPSSNTSGPRIGVFDGSGNALMEYDIPPALAPTGISMPPLVKAGSVYSWFTGSGIVALNADSSVPVWTLPGALGSGAVMSGRLLVPVDGAVAVLDTVTGRQLSQISVDRHGYAGPVQTTIIGNTILEQRGAAVFALA